MTRNITSKKTYTTHWKVGPLPTASFQIKLSYPNLQDSWSIFITWSAPSRSETKNHPQKCSHVQFQSYPTFKEYVHFPNEAGTVPANVWVLLRILFSSQTDVFSKQILKMGWFIIYIICNIHKNNYMYNIYSIPPESYYFTADFKKKGWFAPRLGVACSGRSGSQFPIPVDQILRMCFAHWQLQEVPENLHPGPMGRWADAWHLKIFLSREMAHPWWPHFKTVTMASWDVAVIKMLAFKSGRIR